MSESESEYSTLQGKIRSNLVYLESYTANVSELTLKLVQKFVLTTDERQDIMNFSRESEKAAEVYSTLLKRLDLTIYAALIDSLKQSGNTHISDKLELENKGNIQNKNAAYEENDDYESQYEELIEKCNTLLSPINKAAGDPQKSVSSSQPITIERNESPAPSNISSEPQTAQYNQLKRRSRQTVNHMGPVTERKYDLSSWKYTELRDTINTSCDLELIETCHEEFYRRLKGYRAWKAQKLKRNQTATPESNDSPLYKLKKHEDPLPSVSPTAPPISEFYSTSTTSFQQHRCFRIAFNKGGQVSSIWFGHFYGQMIARQIELFPGRKPILLIAGRGQNDSQMCHLTLKESGLEKSKGSEITQLQFDKEWYHYGGVPYISPESEISEAEAQSLC